MTAGKRLRVLVLLLALASALAFAATASAETRAGESMTVLTEFTPTPEATIVKASASYDANGNVTFDLTTAGAASPGSEGEIYAALTTSSNCAPATGRERLLRRTLLRSHPSDRRDQIEPRYRGGRRRHRQPVCGETDSGHEGRLRNHDHAHGHLERNREWQFQLRHHRRVRR